MEYIESLEQRIAALETRLAEQEAYKAKLIDLSVRITELAKESKAINERCTAMMAQGEEILRQNAAKTPEEPEIPEGPEMTESLESPEYLEGPAQAGPVVVGGGGGGGTIIIGGGGGSVSGGSVAGGQEAPVVDTEAIAAVSSSVTTMAGGTVVSPVPQVNPELEEATSNYVEELKNLTEMLHKVSEQSERLARDSEEMENLNRTLTGICKIYEMQLKGASAQIGTIDEINEQTRKMADQIAELNQIYTRMIEAMTVNMPKVVKSEE